MAVTHAPAEIRPAGLGTAMTGLCADEIRARKGGRRLAMLTAYDYPTALALDECGLDLILVGDSLAELELGEASTRAATLAIMAHHVRAVRNGVTRTHLVGDLPAATYRTPREALASARALREAGAESVKLEGALTDAVRAIVAAGIPVMGHVGLTPQTSTALGGYRAQGRSAAAAERIAREALALQEAGCFAIVFEAIPSAVAAEIMPSVEVPVIGIGAGPATDGQVLVFHDLLGIRDGMGGRFVKRYASLLDEMTAGVAAFADDVRARRYPAPEHGYSIEPEELEAFRHSL